MPTRLVPARRLLIHIFMVTLLLALTAGVYPALSQQKPEKSTLQFDKAPKGNDALFGSLQPIENGPGVLIAAPVSSDSHLAEAGAGVSLWLQYALTSSPALGKMPTMTQIQAVREELHKPDLRLSAADAAELAKRIGVTHFLVGEISGSEQKVTLTYHLYAAGGSRPLGTPLVLEGSTESLPNELPEFAKRIAAAVGVPNFTPGEKPALTAKDLGTLGRFDWTSMPDPTVPALKEISALGAKHPLAALMALRYRRYLSDVESGACVVQIDRASADNPLPLAEMILSNTLPIPPRKASIEHLSQTFANCCVATVMMARLLRQEENSDEEQKAAERAVRLSAGNPQAWLSLAHVYDDRAERLRRGRTAGDITEEEWKTLRALYVKWIGALVRATRLDGSSAHAWSRLAVAATFLSDKETAYQAYDTALELNPNGSEALIWGLQMFQPKWFDDQPRMVKLVDSILGADFPSGDIAAEMSGIFQALGLPSAPLAEKFIARQKQLIKDKPGNPSHYYSLALFYEGTERYEEAAPLFEKLLTMGIAKQEYFGHALLCWQQAGKTDRAEALAKRKVELHLNDTAVAGAAPSNPNGAGGIGALLGSHRQQAVQYFKDKKFDEAEKEYKEIIRLEPDNPSNYTDLAFFYRDRGRHDDEIAAAKQAVSHDKTDDSAFTLYSLLTEVGRNAEALDVVKITAGKEISNPQLYIAIGTDYLKKGNVAEARKMSDLSLTALQKSRNRDNDTPAVYLFLGDVLAKQGKAAEAKAAWQKAALDTASSSFAVKEAMARLTAAGSGSGPVSPTTPKPGGQSSSAGNSGQAPGRSTQVGGAKPKPPAGGSPGHPSTPPVDTSPAARTEQANTLFARAQQAVSAHKYDEGLLEIKEALKINPKPFYYHRILADCLAGLGRKDEALVEMRTAARLDEDDYGLSNLVNLLKDMGRMKEAVQEVRLSKKNRKVPAIYLEALAFLKNTNALKEGDALADMAIEAVDKSNGSANSFGAAHTYKGDILALLGRKKEAEGQWQAVLDNPLKDDYWTEQAKVRLNTGSAVAGGNSAADPKDDTPNPAAARVHWEKSREFSKAKDYKGYERELREAVRLDPNNDYYHYELSSILQQTGQKKEALVQLREAARVSQEDTYCLNVYEELKSRGSPDEAIQEAKKGIAKPVHRTILLYVTLGKYNLDQGAADEAMKMANIGFEIQKGRYKVEFFDPDLYLLKGDILQKQDKKAEAREAWQKAADYSNKDIQSVKDAKKRLDDNP